MRRRLVLGGGVLVAVLATAGVLGLGGGRADGQHGGDDDDGRAAGESAIDTALATVERRDLEEREELDGTLSFGETRDVALGGAGTITGLAPEGSVVERGGALGEVNGAPVTLFYGSRPLWRAVGEGADTSDGPDVQQIEENLIALGYGTAATLGPNETWSAATTAAVKRWQEATGLAETGRIEPGAVVFAEGPVRVADHIGAVGSPAGSPALRLGGTSRVVTVDLDADRQGLLAAGQGVEVELPDGSVVPATVYSVATVVEPGDPQQGTGPTLEVVVLLDDEAAAGGLDEAPVDVRVVSVAAADALAVPVEALLALAEGGYAVERPDGSLVAVQVGAFADGYVEVAGDLAEGDAVVVPA